MAKKYIARWNQRVDGVVQEREVILTKKNGKYYTEEGKVYEPNGSETISEYAKS